MGLVNFFLHLDSHGWRGGDTREENVWWECCTDEWQLWLTVLTGGDSEGVGRQRVEMCQGSKRQSRGAEMHW